MTIKPLSLFLAAAATGCGTAKSSSQMILDAKLPTTFGQISNVVNFDAFPDFQKLQAASHRRMLDCLIVGNVLDLGVGNAASIIEERRHPAAGDVAVLINRR